jgi:hypothetical protein
MRIRLVVLSEPGFLFHLLEVRLLPSSSRHETSFPTDQLLRSHRVIHIQLCIVPFS